MINRKEDVCPAAAAWTSLSTKMPVCCRQIISDLHLSPGVSRPAKVVISRVKLLSLAAWVCPELRTLLCEPGTQVGCSQVEEPNLSQQGSKRLCKCMNRDNISVMRPVLYHQSLQKGLKPDLPPSTDNPSVIAPYYLLFCQPAKSLSFSFFARVVVF